MTTTTIAPSQIADQARLPHLPVTFYSTLDAQFASWAIDCGWDRRKLRRASKWAVRTRHHESRIDHPAHRARGRQPNIYTLDLESIEMYYTIEEDAVVIRGFGWTLDREPRDDFECGGLFYEYSWSLPV